MNCLHKKITINALIYKHFYDETTIFNILLNKLKRFLKCNVCSVFQLFLTLMIVQLKVNLLTE